MDGLIIFGSIAGALVVIIVAVATYITYNYGGSNPSNNANPPLSTYAPYMRANALSRAPATERRPASNNNGGLVNPTRYERKRKERKHRKQ
jgi:hypothetical protein